jgi:DUF917 family protein
MPIILDALAVEEIALGAAILGSGGGGDPYIGMLMAKQAIALHGPVELIGLDEVPDDAWIMPPGVIGAPTVTIEKLPSGKEASHAIHMLEDYLQVKAYALFPGEIGGGNSMVPLIAAAVLRLPVVDADAMGRAFPEIQMTTAGMHGVRACPLSLCDEKGNGVIVDTPTNLWAERIARSVTVQMGGCAHICNYAMAGSRAKTALIAGSVSLAWKTGRELMRCRREGSDPIAGLVQTLDGEEIGRGKITDMQRGTEGGFSRGEVAIAGGTKEGLRVAFQNENLVAWRGKQVAVTTPDLIVIVDEATGSAIPTESLRYGQRVVVLGVPANPMWRTAEGLALVGPRYFGYDFDYARPGVEA